MFFFVLHIIPTFQKSDLYLFSLKSIQLLYQVLECKPMQQMSSASGYRCYIGTVRSDCKPLKFDGIKTADLASNVHTFSSLWEQRHTLIYFLSSDTQWTYWDLQHWLATKPKLPTTFPCARTQMDAEGHSFTHPFSIHTYTLITIMNGFCRQSITVNKMNLWTEHVFGWDRSTQPLSQAAWGTDKKGLQTKEAITLLSLCMSAFQKPLSAAKETKTMPSVLLGNWCVTFIRCLGRVWGEEGSWVGGVGGGEGGVEGVERGWVAKLLTPIQSYRVWSE